MQPLTRMFTVAAAACILSATTAVSASWLIISAKTQDDMHLAQYQQDSAIGGGGFGNGYGGPASEQGFAYGNYVYPPSDVDILPPSTGVTSGQRTAHAEWCGDRYTSYRASDDTFQPNDGPRQACVSPFLR